MFRMCTESKNIRAQEVLGVMFVGNSSLIF